MNDIFVKYKKDIHNTEFLLPMIVEIIMGIITGEILLARI